VFLTISCSLATGEKKKQRKADADSAHRFRHKIIATRWPLPSAIYVATAMYQIATPIKCR